MEMIRVYNRKTGEILEKTFANSKAADNYEVILDFLMAEYERYHDGKRLYCEGDYFEDFVDDYDGWDDDEYDDWDDDEEDY